MSVIPIRQTFTAVDVLASAPAAMRADPLDVQVAAMALAAVNGDRWDKLSPQLQERYRQRVVKAAMEIDPNDAKLVAYVIEGQMSAEFPMWDLVHRRQQTMGLACAEAETAGILSGTSPVTLDARMALLASDEHRAKTHGWKW